MANVIKGTKKNFGGNVLKFQDLIYLPLNKPIRKVKIGVDSLAFTLYIVSVLRKKL